MTRLTLLCATGVLSVLFLLHGNCLAGSVPANSAAFVGGTVSAIPVNTAGQLDLSDAEMLRFQYGESSYAIPYDSIVSFRRGRGSNGGFGKRITGGAAKVGGTILPMLFSKKKYLTVEFRAGEDTTTQQAVFQVSGDTADAAIPVLKARTRKTPEAGPTTAATLSEEDSWWGNRLWRTNRNRHLWPDPGNESGTTEVEVAAKE